MYIFIIIRRNYLNNNSIKLFTIFYTSWRNIWNLFLIILMELKSYSLISFTKSTFICIYILIILLCIKTINLFLNRHHNLHLKLNISNNHRLLNNYFIFFYLFSYLFSYLFYCLFTFKYYLYNIFNNSPYINKFLYFLFQMLLKNLKYIKSYLIIYPELFIYTLFIYYI